MKDAIFAACGALAIAGTMTVAAQTTPQTPSSTQPSTRSTEQGRTVTVTGCLKQWDSSMGAIPGASSASGTRYVLTDVDKAGSSSGSTASGTSGTTGGTASGTTGTASGTTGTTGGTMAGRSSSGNDDTQYVVTAESSSVNLSQHLNHQVRITGRTQPISSTMTSTGSGTTGGTATGTSGTTGTGTTGTGTTGTGSTASRSGSSMGGDKWQALTATSITMVAQTCQ